VFAALVALQKAAHRATSRSPDRPSVDPGLSHERCCAG
jgi:hypothetical protein